ncbi:hypothetical protein RD110_18640 [Rhodoferax koreense]|uniref:HK97 gp10 family phage protein n=1 Tax=Rhodoferax koreensis TaxID=1842727 RepID=A0A1P8JYZ6_9BURK|nr:hypothetical protein [Rhodoferax koreense]APW38973.1 hypothetical protein RD110_18640 [Rhodoferax koreense]
MSNAGVHVSVSFAGHTRIDFDKKPIKRTLRQEGAQIRKQARRLLSRRAVSVPGEMPGRQTGALMRSIKVKVASGGFWAKVAPYKTNEMKKFYPAFLFYGSTKRNFEKRGNYMESALDTRRAAAQSAIRSALQGALKPR